MADPQVKSPMDGLDYLSVILYRLGFTLAAIVVGLLPWKLIPWNLELILVCAALCASSLHIYLKSFRLLLQFATWVGLLCALFGFPMIALGGAFITLGGLCFKEQFCFKVPGLQFQPVILAALWFSLQLQVDIAATIFATIAGLLFLATAIAKWRMPLHFDIGDKTKYEI